ncbi:hypothetical protein BH23ACT4_BH23ACT4_14900 [soil metagenome]
MPAAIDRAKRTLLNEKDRLQRELTEISRALEALDGRTEKGSLPSHEKLTCGECGFEAKGRQGLAGHRRIHRRRKN